MKFNFFKKWLVGIILSGVSLSVVYSAEILISAPAKNANNRNPVMVQVLLDSKRDTISGISGNFSFPSDLYTLSDISTESSVVSLWVKQPTISQEKYLDGRTHVQFEGIFPGGFKGVESPYYQGVRPGIVFSVKLTPKNKGKGVFTVDEIVLNEFSSSASPLPTMSAIKSFEIPALPTETPSLEIIPFEIKSPTLTALITRDPLINNNAWYVIINEREQKSSIEKVLIAETNNRHPFSVDDFTWRQVESPHVLFFQNRTKYVHIKVIYSNNSYAFRTLPPVENSQSIPFASRILVGIASSLLVLYFYGKFFFIPRQKQTADSQ